MTRKLFLLFALATLIPAQAYASFDGRATGGTSCGGCHGSASTEVATVVSGPLTMVEGTTANFSVLINPQLGVGAGVDVALAGLAGATLGVIDANTQILSLELVHTDASSGLPNGNIGDWAYNFSVTAPMSLGTILINAVMLAFNGDEDNSDLDLWAAAPQFSVDVVPVPELSTVVLLGSGIAGLVAIGRRRSSHAES